MAENSRIRITSDDGVGRRRSISGPQWGAVLGGSALAIYGITRRSPLGMALAAGGGTVALVAGARKRSVRPPSTWTTLLVNCSPQEAYRFWRDFENLPRFMNRLQSVTVLDDRRSRWIALGPMGRQIRWDAEITDERENESISWRSLPGSDIQVHGEVRFQEAPAGRGTLIGSKIEYTQASGMNGALAKFLSKGANFAMRQDMRRLEALMEAGEIPTTEGQPHGPRDFVTGVMRVADPTRPIAPGSNLKEVFAARRDIA
ncbi:MAG TPA: SRPBCC family protein [Dongiaceae bacterium]|nr:SRPBCC family protein [Dongiaceae bacterium]